MKKLSLTLLVLFIAISASASPLWMRYSQISPNAENIAFAYKGDIYTVSAQGGVANQLTTLPSYESVPMWSPDGKFIAFTSDRNGNYDIYMIPVTGGEAKRITTNSSKDVILGFSKDGKQIYFSSAMQKPAKNINFPTRWNTELYSVGVDGARPEQITDVAVMNMSLAADGKSFVYENRTGSENDWRKHHVSSVARNIFYYNAADNSHKQLTENVGEDRNPILTADGKVLFLSQKDGGTFNVYQGELSDLDKAVAVTSFTEHPVRFLSQANDGTLSYGFHGEIYTQKMGEEPKKLAVTINNDLSTEQIDPLSFTSGREYAMTADGKQIVFINRGEVFAGTDKYSTTKQISNTAAAEKGVTISPDGKTIAYASERNDIWNIYTSKVARDEEVNFANATLIDEQPLFENPELERFAPQFSPDGEELAFVEDRNRLMVINLKTKKVRQITDGENHYRNDDYGLEYRWSPDGKWFAMSVVSNVRDPYSDIIIVSAEDGGKMYNITNSAYIDSNPQWVLGGNAIAYSSNRLGLRAHASWGSQNDVFIAFLNQDAYDKFTMNEEAYSLVKAEEALAKKLSSEKKDKKKTKKDDKKEAKKEAKKEIKLIDIELEKLEDRVLRITPMSSDLAGYALSKDGEKLYFLAAFEGTYDLWGFSIRKRSSRIIGKRMGYGDLQLSEDGKTLFVLGASSKKVNLASSISTPLSFRASMDMNLNEEREYMFDHVFKQQTKRFYKEGYHGVDLIQLRKDYYNFLPHINNNHDFSEMLSEILGELNVSHTGSGYFPRPGVGSNYTAELGLLFDLKFEGDGLKIDEVLEYGPFDKKYSKVKPGDVIEKIDGVEIKANEDYYPLLNKKANKKVLVSIYSPATKERWEQVVKPTGKAGLNHIMYKRWIKSRAEETSRLSGGRLGYVHIASMDDDSYRDVYSDILGKYNHCDGIVIDTRNNGGGRLHEDIEVLFSGEKYLEQVVRGKKSCEMPSRRYNKPSIMLICEANYSNAHGTPWVYKHKGLGSLVGMPVPGTMTSVNWETLQDNSMYFGIPVIGYKTIDGVYLENFQLEPDFKVVNTPEKSTIGTDEQLEVAVKELLKQIDANPTW